MTNVKTLLRLAGPLAMILAAGCAPAYHSYSDCCVPCGYCVPPPLPYTHYPGCVCHSCAASQYLWYAPDASEPTAEDTQEEDTAG